MPIAEKECAASYKVLVVGDQSVGKTALLRSLSNQEFREKALPTVGPDFIDKIFEVDGALVHLRIWDSPGHERLRSMTRQQYSDVQGLVLVYDVTDELSFESISYWIHSINSDFESKKTNYLPTPVILIGNKADLICGKKVSTAKAEQFADKELMFGFYETSAKTGENVVDAFHRLAYHITELQNPMFMTSYHPSLIRRASKIVYKPTPAIDTQRHERKKDRKKTRTKDKKQNKLNIQQAAICAPDSNNRLSGKQDNHRKKPSGQDKGTSDGPRSKISCLFSACFKQKGD